MAAAERSNRVTMACHGCISPQVAAHTREWVNTPPQRGWQKQKPLGDNTAWRPRRPDTTKFITNARKGIKHELKLAVAAFDKLPTQPTQASLEYASQELQRCYRKLLFLDKYGIVLTKKFDGPQKQIAMTREQSEQNDYLRSQENAPMIDTWFEEAQAVSLERGDPRPTTLKASSSATPMPPLATPLPPRVPPPPPPIPDVQSTAAAVVLRLATVQAGAGCSNPSPWRLRI